MQHFHQASYQHSMVSGFYPVEDGAVIDEETATYRATHPELGAHYGRTIGTCRCNLLVMQLCREGDTGFSNRRGWVPVNDIAAAYAENALLPPGWVCANCGRDLDGNPPHCPHCGSSAGYQVK